MKAYHYHKRILGIALIEVLIAAFVVGVGLMGVASLQGNFADSSRENKTRAEALALANTKIEEYRDRIERSSEDEEAETYINLASGADSPKGITENFTRRWTVTDQVNPERKLINVTVCWPSGCPGTGDQKVSVQSVIAFDSVNNSILVAKGNDSTAAGGVSSPSTNAESSDEITQAIQLSASATPGSVVTVGGKTYIVKNTGTSAILAISCTGLNDFENNLKTRRLNYDNASGNEAIELYEVQTISGVDYCIPRIRYNGGVIIPIRGIVHSGATLKEGGSTTLRDVDLFAFNASETGAYCVFKPEPNAKSAPYVCYVGGNCKNFVGTTDDTDVTSCPSGSYSAERVGPGGWRGKIGLLKVAGSSSSFFNVCFEEELTSTPVSLDTARNYYTRRAGLNEGINKPYSCHDFLIIDGQSNESKVSGECIKQANAIGGFNLASKTIQRTIASGDNIFDPVIDTGFCFGSTGTSYVITGSITGTSGGIPSSVSVMDGVFTLPCSPISATSYTCSITTSASSLTISGIYLGQPVSCSLSPPSSSGCDLAFTSVPTYTIAGKIIGTSTATGKVALSIVDGSNSAPCLINDDHSGSYRTYTCLLGTINTTGIYINSTALLGYSVTPANGDVPALSGTTGSVIGPDFTATTVSTYTVSGNITLDKAVDNITSLTVSLTNGSCTLNPPSGGWKKSSTGSYSCNAYVGTNSLTFAISPTCSDAKGKSSAFKYSMSTSGGSSLGTGQLVIDLGSITSAITRDISISESTTPCGT